MKQTEKIIFYEYFLNRINKLENDYEMLLYNMRVKSFKYCDELDFLDLATIKNELDYTVNIYQELQMLLKL